MRCTQTLKWKSRTMQTAQCLCDKATLSPQTFKVLTNIKLICAVISELKIHICAVK